MLIFHVFHSFFTFYELRTSPIVEIHVFYTLGNIYIEPFNVFVGCFRSCPFLSLHIFVSSTILGFLHQFVFI